VIEHGDMPGEFLESFRASRLPVLSLEELRQAASG
jgi:hypothetical protein